MFYTEKFSSIGVKIEKNRLGHREGFLRKQTRIYIFFYKKKRTTEVAKRIVVVTIRTNRQEKYTTPNVGAHVFC